MQNLRSDLEEEFIEWFMKQKKSVQEHIDFDHFDEDLGILFLKRTEAFNRALIKSLQEEVSKKAPHVRVSTMVYPELR